MPLTPEQARETDDILRAATAEVIGADLSESANPFVSWSNPIFPTTAAAARSSTPTHLIPTTPATEDEGVALVAQVSRDSRNCWRYQAAQPHSPDNLLLLFNPSLSS